MSETDSDGVLERPLSATRLVAGLSWTKGRQGRPVTATGAAAGRSDPSAAEREALKNVLNAIESKIAAIRGTGPASPRNGDPDATS